MKTKKIIQITSIALLFLTLTLLITTLVNYYKYIGTINQITAGDTDLITKFTLQENKEKFLYSTLKTLVWSAYIGIVTIIITVTSIILNNKKENKTIKKIR